ncbi:hypothetical protein TL16_g12220 [Triparma laevis f. inornata]|uniref:Uncharacterized protein n=1 Tax=Triparma laevis f. inornata TaxID=1714386 RepID=A0A9W7BKD1_9STRA|nr:hypothetical protein TL16_g12220 [Triparma laevis f. inornata]
MSGLPSVLYRSLMKWTRHPSHLHLPSSYLPPYLLTSSIYDYTSMSFKPHSTESCHLPLNNILRVRAAVKCAFNLRRSEEDDEQSNKYIDEGA